VSRATGNARLRQINAKFGQLNSLFDRAIAQPDAKPLSPEIARAYAEFKKPIPLKDCP
jgi:hypothetical protein